MNDIHTAAHSDYQEFRQRSNGGPNQSNSARKRTLVGNVIFMRARIRVPKQLNLRKIMPRRREFNEFDVIDAAISYFGADDFLDASMRKNALRADVSCGSLYNSFGDKRSLFRSALVQSVERSFRRAIEADPPQLSPFRKIERFFVHPARSDARLLIRAGFEAENLDTDCSAIVSETIEAIEKYLTECVYAGQLQGEIIRTQPSTELGSLLLTTLLSMSILFRLRPERRPLEEVVRPTLHQLRTPKIS
ncbi:TetR/AcrR family transcriptional regulator [Paraburkholderia sp. LEh10]|uniref:TetR/AcrR family transcriptional regulator n=1 Tax=Paraburkholderia sp. LEh10 TaxID=2821353 RepID=UPI001AE2A7C0|nr:TetR/AcrR family transcriptional regulator [Paraburkholderia sp. LEh10]MBP0594191.1 TetR/AcrR family transcriptional regulator [Paraburkholderia sp. LEh10]